jgi:hypothetical protein
LLKNFLLRSSKHETPNFSADPQENPPHNTVLKCKQAFVPRAFPPIHSAHHNNKNGFYEKSFVEMIVGVKNSCPVNPCDSVPKFLSSSLFPQVQALQALLCPLYFAKKRVQYASG